MCKEKKTEAEGVGYSYSEDGTHIPH